MKCGKDAGEEWENRLFPKMDEVVVTGHLEWTLCNMSDEAKLVQVPTTVK